jgi:CTP:molybdopterin cytidylyltransferase MocA
MRKFISGLVLGAGSSTRLGEPKQLLAFGNTTLLGWVVAQAQDAAGLDEVVVVLGRAADAIRRRVEFGKATVVEDPVFGEGCLLLSRRHQRSPGPRRRADDYPRRPARDYPCAH